MGGGTQWKQEPSQNLRVVTPNGSLNINVHTIGNASRVIREMLDPPKTEVNINLSSEGFGVLAHWLRCGELDKCCTEAGTMVDLKRLCKAYTTGQVLEIESRFLDKVLDCIIDCVTEADRLTIFDIETITRYLMRTFKEETGGRRFLRAWLIMGHMGMAQHEVGFSPEIARLLQRASGDIWPLSYYKVLREHSEKKEQELPWVLYRCHYHLHGPETRCSETSGMERAGTSSSEDGETSEVDGVNEFGEISEASEENEDGEMYEVDGVNASDEVSEASYESQESEESGDGEESVDGEDSGINDR
ncbi:hypothetical protein LTS10_013062 [Elasticomyces elasticus]|nr:hypothetical protein LTS10_013062 [Elasticomyces elasticus]